MTLPRLKGFAEYWDETPPVNESVAAIFQKKDEGSAHPSDPHDLLMQYPRKE